MKVATSSSELRAAIAGALVLTSAAWLTLRQLPTPRPVVLATTPLQPTPAPTPRATPRPLLQRVGPLVVGNEVALGYRITRIDFEADAIRLELTRPGTKPIRIGVSPKRAQRERPVPVEFSNLDLWYVGRGATPPEYGELARAVWTVLDRAARPRSPSDTLPEWKRAALDAH